jgi:hypothetical protein
MTHEAFDALLRLINTMVEAKVNDPDGEGFYRGQIETATDEARRLIVRDTTQ